jgi:alpha-beta hydrolase superfamily lysophospholipase
MRRSLLAGIGIVAIGIAAFVAAEASNRVPAMAANGLLHPMRRAVFQRIPDNCENVTFPGVGVTLKGWRCHATGEPRGTLIHLHGIADNRGSASNVIQRYTARGFDVIAYDSRAHGDSEGSICTYGYFEKDDLRQIIGGVEHTPIVLIGTSLGAAIALQAAAGEPRIAGVVAAETFSDLRTVARERAPWILSEDIVARAFQLAEKSGEFEVDAVSPEKAARRIRVPVLLIHGADDRDTAASHSQRVLAALAGPKRLILVEGAGHNQSLRQEKIWVEIDRWIADAVSVFNRRIEG